MQRFCGRRALFTRDGVRDSIKGEAGSTVLSSTEQIKHDSVESSTDHLCVCSASLINHGWWPRHGRRPQRRREGVRVQPRRRQQRPRVRVRPAGPRRLRQQLRTRRLRAGVRRPRPAARRVCAAGTRRLRARLRRWACAAARARPRPRARVRQPRIRRPRARVRRRPCSAARLWPCRRRLPSARRLPGPRLRAGGVPVARLAPRRRPHGIVPHRARRRLRPRSRREVQGRQARQEVEVNPVAGTHVVRVLYVRVRSHMICPG